MVMRTRRFCVEVVTSEASARLSVALSKEAAGIAVAPFRVILPERSE